MIVRISKTAQAKNMWLEGDYRGCLKLLRRFRFMSETNHVTFDKGYEAIVHPNFYAQMHGKVWVAEMQSIAIAAVDAYYGEKI